MKSIAQNKRYLPHEISTKVQSVKLYRQTKDIGFVCRRYHISKASLMRWNKLYDGTKESLTPKSHRPRSPHPSAHSEQELKWIKDLHRRNPDISVNELYGKLRQQKAYSRHPGSLYRVFIRLGYRQKAESTKKKSRHNGHYDTPRELGIKWQMDVKYVPAACYVGTDGEKFYQYTMIDEASMSTFRRSNMISFARYTLDELLAIVRYRAGLALSDGALSDESAELIANVSSEFGDARYALEILERAAHVAETAGESEVTPDCIRTASASVYSDVSEVKLNNLDRNKKIVLLSISRAIKSAASVSMTKCEKTYAVVCEEYNVPAKKHTQFYTYVMDMEKMALLRTEVKREPDGGRVTYISIDNIPPKELANKLEYLLDEEARGETDLE